MRIIAWCKKFCGNCWDKDGKHKDPLRIKKLHVLHSLYKQANLTSQQKFSIDQQSAFILQESSVEFKSLCGFRR